MKKSLLFAIVITILASGCGSSKKQLESGNYDAAIDKAVKQLRKDSNDDKQIEILESAYRISNDRDNERIRLLKAEGKPGNWDEIYVVYKRMYDRQAYVKTVTPVNGKTRSFDVTYVDYMNEMVFAKRKAADFYYGHGQELMKNKTKESYRQANAEFMRAKEYVGDYEGIDNLITESRYLGMSRVLITVQNQSIINFPQEFTNSLLALDLPRLNSEWVEYHPEVLDENTQFDYVVYINVKNVAVSPDLVAQRDSAIKRDIEDGFSYVLDKNGNVMRDSLGNDIKVKKYKTVQCALIETVQTKRCRIDGEVEIVGLNPNRLLKKDPIGADSYFEHVSARAIGDVAALSPAQLERTRGGQVPFPTDVDMILRTSDALKMAIRGIVQNNRRFIF